MNRNIHARLDDILEEMRRLIYSKHFFPILISGVTIGILFFMLRTNFILGQLRYFDMDELFYVSLARHVTLGLVPYRDFFFGVTPGYLWFLTPIFLFKTGVEALLAARGVSFVVFLSLMAVTSILYFLMRRSWTVVFVSFFLAFLPIPQDKLLEIRPDTISLTLALGATALQFYWMQNIERKKVHRLYILFLIGLLYALSLFIFPKTATHIGIALAGLGVFLLVRGREHENTTKHVLQIILSIFFGGGIVCVGFLLWIFVLGLDFWLVVNSIVKIPVEVTKLGYLFPIPPDFYFRPNDVFYGSYGYHVGFITNAIIWGIGLLIAITRVFTIFFQKKASVRLMESILISSLFVQLYLYVSVYPFKHSQYLIPIAVFVCFFAADAIGILWQWMRRRMFTQGIFVVVMIGVLITCYQSYRIVTLPKLGFSNASSLHELNVFLRVVPENTYVLDLTGLTMEYPTPYYVMHLPFGQFAQFLSTPLPALIPNLKALDVPIIYAGGRLNTLTLEDQEFIYKEYTAVGNGNVLVRNDDLPRFDFSSL